MRWCSFGATLMAKSGETIDYERALEKVLASRDWDSRQQAIDFLDKHLRDAELSPPQEGVIWIWEYNGPVLDENGKYVGGPNTAP